MTKRIQYLLECCAREDEAAFDLDAVFVIP